MGLTGKAQGTSTGYTDEGVKTNREGIMIGQNKKC